MRTSLTCDGFAECARGTSEAARRKEQGMSADVWSLGCIVIEMFTGRALKSDFKSPEGRYKLQYEKTHTAGLLHYYHRKSVSQLIIAYLKEKSASQGPSAPSTLSSSSVVKSAAAWLFVGVIGSKTFSYGGTNGGSKVASGTSKFGGTFGAGSSSSPVAFNYDGKMAYLIFNDGSDQRPIHFSSSNPLCHSFDSEATEAKYGHDLLIVLQSGDSEFRYHVFNICVVAGIYAAVELGNIRLSVARIASKLGIPLAVDTRTTQKTRLSFTRLPVYPILLHNQPWFKLSEEEVGVEFHMPLMPEVKAISDLILPAPLILKS
ncbi:hypothetical protein KFK09_013327 [Dendrobium nobile]|uniref:Protein kinase domain-containing protein n=1 Tax=Dendrobium nobile TaxID=94219 RepID=A0A8T3B8I4_DENNO|nr:hypothetical protein KFK09_013327 [Dendrobium nobile]